MGVDVDGGGMDGNAGHEKNSAGVVRNQQISQLRIWYFLPSAKIT